MGSVLSFISCGDKSLTSFVDNIDQLFRCAKGQIEIIYLSGLQNSKRQRALPATHDNQQLKVLAGGQVQRSVVKQVVISFSQLSEWKNPAGFISQIQGGWRWWVLHGWGCACCGCCYSLPGAGCVGGLGLFTVNTVLTPPSLQELLGPRARLRQTGGAAVFHGLVKAGITPSHSRICLV